MVEVPDLSCYSQISKERGVAVRCPFATVEVCPRYYQSLSLLGEAGSTKIPLGEDARLLAKWRTSDLWPRTAEQATSLFGPAGNPHRFNNFCPEVIFERFGYFATYLAQYADEIDMALVHDRLSKGSAPANDPRWSWASVSGQHYTECPVYAVLAHRAKAVDPSSQQAHLPWWRKYLVELIVGLIVAVVGGLVLKFFG